MSFDTLAPHYSWMEKVLAGQLLQKCRTAFLADVTQAKRVLIAGEGHGRFLEAFLPAAPGAQITVVEASGGMIAAAQARLRRLNLNSDRVQFIHEDIRKVQFDRPFDLIVTNFFLDCFAEQELAKVIAFLSSQLSDGGLWLISDFQIPSRGWKRARARIVLALAYSFFRVATRLPARKLVAPGPFLEANGLRLEKERRFSCELLCSQVWRRRRG